MYNYVDVCYTCSSTHARSRDKLKATSVRSMPLNIDQSSLQYS